MRRRLEAWFHRRMAGRARRLADRLAPHVPPGTQGLDIGSGTGHNAVELRGRTDGTWLEADVVDFHVVGPGPLLFDGRRLPLADGAVDVCLLAHVLSHAADPAGLLREASRVASRRVLVIESTYRTVAGGVYLTWRGWLQGAGAFAACRALGLIPPACNPMRRPRRFSREALERAIAAAGMAACGRDDGPGLLGGTGRELLVLGRRGDALGPGPRISVIIPARNEAAMLGSTIESVLRSAGEAAGRAGAGVEIVVVDNASTDGTAGIVEQYARTDGVRHLICPEPGAARARNLGARESRGEILIFLDADTHLAPGAIARIVDLCVRDGFEAGITRLGALDGGVRARCWWAFWNAVRRLPLARAKAMPACMFCTRAAFEMFGPFDERVAIGEEWPILAGLYRARRRRLVYDRATVALSSSRRMELQRLGYTRTFLKYAWAILCFRGRVHYDDRVRHAESPPPLRCAGSELPG